MPNFYFTRKGLESFKNHIELLEKNLRYLQAQTAYVAEVGGDQYHDNSSYELLTIDIRGADRRLSDAHLIINNAVIVERITNNQRVAIGTQVLISVSGKEGKSEQKWIIGGFGESDPENGIIAYNVPLAKLLIGKEEGHCIRSKLGEKDVEIEILEIEIAREEK